MLTRETKIVGEIFGPLCSCASGFLSAAFNSYSSSSHPSLYLPPLHCQPVKCIPLKYVVVDGYVLETQTKQPRTCSNFLWFNSSLFCASALIHSICCRYFTHFPSSSQNKNSLCWYVVISPVHGPVSLLGSLIFSVAYLIPSYMQYVEIFRTTTHLYSSDEKILLMSSIQVQNFDSNFPFLVIFDNHGILG